MNSRARTRTQDPRYRRAIRAISTVLQARQQAECCETRMKRLQLSGWDVDSTIILSLWTSQEDQGCLANWRGGATSSSASRQNAGRRHIQRL